MDSDVTRRNFMKRSALMDAGVALGGPMSAYAAHSASGGPRRAALGYGALRPTPEIDTRWSSMFGRRPTAGLSCSTTRGCCDGR